MPERTLYLHRLLRHLPHMEPFAKVTVSKIRDSNQDHYRKLLMEGSTNPQGGSVRKQRPQRDYTLTLRRRCYRWEIDNHRHLVATSCHKSS